MFFKGFVKTKGKKCVETFKNRTDFKTLEQVQSLDEYAGILEKDAVLIDIDDGEQAEVLMNIVEDLQLNCCVYQTTRGKHFLFKNTRGQIQKCFTHANPLAPSPLGCVLRLGRKGSGQSRRQACKRKMLDGG